MTAWDVVRNLVLATRWTILLSLIAFAGGIVLGLLILPLRIAFSRVLRALSRGYVELFQGTPLLMQIFIVFFGLPMVGVRPTPWLAAAVTLTLWSAAFLAEIWRGCVLSVSKGQWEASASLGMSYFEQMRWIIVPQALRLALAPTVGFMVQIVKGTALTSIIGFVEVSRAGGMITNVTFKPFQVYGLVALIYFLLCWPLSKGSRMLERRLNVAHRDH